MNHRNKLLLMISLAMVLVVISFGVGACDGSYTLHIQNQTDQTLSIAVLGRDKGFVRPAGELKVDVLTIYLEYPIEAKNEQGEVLFSKKFTAAELTDMRYTVVITDNRTPVKP